MSGPKKIFVFFGIMGCFIIKVNSALATNATEERDNSIAFDSITKCLHNKGVTTSINCLSEKIIKALQRALKMDSIRLLPGVALINDQPSSERTAKNLDLAKLPHDPDQRTQELFKIVAESASRFISGRTLKIKIPEFAANQLARAFDEGRGKLKKAVSPLLLGVGLKAILFKVLLMMGLGLMSLKAVVLSKVALFVAVILAAQTLFAGGLGLRSPYYPSFNSWFPEWKHYPKYGPPVTPGYPVWTTNSLGWDQYPYARSIDVKDDLRDTKNSQIA